MALILSIDTATPVCSVALGKGEKIISKIDSAEEKSHASHLAVFIEQLLQHTGISTNQIDAVAISKGPGSFTGLRIGVSVAKGLCFGGDIPLIAVETLKAMALGMAKHTETLNPELLFSRQALYCPMIDARRMEVYTALYDFNNQVVEETKAKVIDEHSFIPAINDRQIVFAGDGADKCKDLIKSRNAFFLTKFSYSAAFMNTIAQRLFDEGRFEDVAYFEPFYLKDFVVTVSKGKMV